MELGLAGQIVIEESFDYALALRTSDGVHIRVESPFWITMPGVRDREFAPAASGEPWHADLGFMGSSVDSSSVGSAGALLLSFSNDVSLRVAPDESYEAWSLTKVDGSRIICSPGGEVVVFS